MEINLNIYPCLSVNKSIKIVPVISVVKSETHKIDALNQNGIEYHISYSCVDTVGTVQRGGVYP